jgi:glutathione synthase/RimK-type ligase-like ATP-grasp enzyme
MSVRVALATCAAVPDLDPDDRPLVPALRRRGVDAVPAVWDDTELDWTQFDLVVLRSTWDYAERRDEFLAWIDELPAVLNPPAVVRWNTDKQRYLSDLARAGVPVVPTHFLEPGAGDDLPEPPLVVKPAISAGGRSSGRFGAGEIDAARALTRRIQAERRTAMVQPLLAAADSRGETALAFVAGWYSHALARRVPLPEPGRPGTGLYLEEELAPREPSESERAVADAALAAAPSPGALLYARVDLLEDEHGRPLVLELELAEPSLYLAFGDGALERFADAIANAVGR